MTARPATESLPSQSFRDDEKVFSHGGYQLLDDIVVPRFGDTRCWLADCIGRAANRRPSEWRIVFPENDPLINLQLREYCFALLNPSHPLLRESLIFLSGVPLSVATIRPSMLEIRKVMRWGHEQGLPPDLGLWDPEDWYAEIAHKASQVEGAKTVAFHVTAIRRLRQLTAVITGISAFEDPWGDEPASNIGAKAYDEDAPSLDTLATPSIPPETWWPLLRGAWTYIHTFAPDIFRWRDQFAREMEVPSDLPRSTKARPTRPQDTDALLEKWLRTPGNAVPVHEVDYVNTKAGTPMWTALSKMITDGRTMNVFADNMSDRTRKRRTMVWAAIGEGRVATVKASVGRGKGSTAPSYVAPGTSPGVTREQLDEDVRRWLANPATLVPVHATDDHGRAGEPIWAMAARMVWGHTPSEAHRHRYAKRLDQRTRTGAARARLLLQAVADGRGIPVDVEAGIGWRAYQLECPDAAHIQREDGTSAPWRTQISAVELAFELHMLRAAVYVFVSALTLMRDSEVQEIQRDAVRTYFGSPAVVSRKTKMDPARPELHWWIIEPVAEALAVLEQLSRHPTHLFVRLAPLTGKPANGEPGIASEAEIDFFINGINHVAHQHGLAKIPPSHVRSHMFRKTMAQLAGREPDSEVALGIQLKHAARRAVANRTTQAYAQMDASWAKEFDTELQQAAARKLVDLLRGRRQGQRVAVGPGAARLHAGLDRVIATIDNDPQLRAQIADERVEEALLADEFPNLHLGTLNHCMFDAPQAECQGELPEGQRGLAPLLGACQPARCRNSTITRAHAPYWVAEEDDLTALSKNPRLSPPNREAVFIRLADVKRITRALEEEGSA
ncbi:hypothetical protein SMIR_41885 (plasmid) [Streptomyces mirabilis]|uniref:hypothetical protein n=1 Tax=Streptomyces mirabilis TaxID=68239 RepID=UPI001BB0994D|nr:hypothetical protein [Streptomyces mirabilis]QUW85601.1 hypothetical protein SMIR_41885 [Streptomyces mirabilis]